MADQQPSQGSSTSESMSAQQQMGGPGQQGGSLVPPSEVPAPAAGLPLIDLIGIVVLIIAAVAVGFLVRRGRPRRKG